MGEVQCYKKRKVTNERACHYILFPVVKSTVGISSDFYFHALNLCWNDKNLLKDPQCQRMFRGFRLTQEIPLHSLDTSAESGWFTGSNASVLAKIGKIAGYFIRIHACSVASALDGNFNVDDYIPVVNKDMNYCVNALKQNKAVTPVVV